MTALTLHPHEVRAWLAGRLGVIVRPLRLNIVETKDLGDEEYDGPEQFFVQDGKLRTPGQWGSHDASDKLPIPHGPFWVRETFADNPCAGGSVVPRGCGHQWGSPIYKATFGAALKPVCEGFSPWRSPVTMPRAYSRIFGTVRDSRVCMLGQMKGHEAFAWGFGGGTADRQEDGYPIASVEAMAFWANKNPEHDLHTWVQVARIERSE